MIGTSTVDIVLMITWRDVQRIVNKSYMLDCLTVTKIGQHQLFLEFPE